MSYRRRPHTRALPLPLGAALILLGAAILVGAAATAGDDPEPIDNQPADEILFRINDISINRSAIEMEFLSEAGPDLKRLADARVSPADRDKQIEKIWNTATEAVIDSAMLRSQARDEWERIQEIVIANPQAIRDAIDRYIQDQLEPRSGGSEEFNKQLQRFGVDRERLRAMLLEKAAIETYLSTKFRNVSESTPDNQRDYFTAHPLEFATKGKVRLQRLALKTTAYLKRPAEELQQDQDQIKTVWQTATREPDVVAAGLSARPNFASAWTVIAPAAPATATDDWIDFDQLPEPLRDAADENLGVVLPPVPVALLRKAKAFSADGPAALREADASTDLVLFFRIAGQHVTVRPYEEVRGLIRDKLNSQLLTKAKDEFFDELRKDTLLTAPAGRHPPISPRLRKLFQPTATEPVPAPLPAPLHTPTPAPAPVGP